MAGTVADLIVATLKASGVRRVYGIPGDSLNGFTDALRRDGAMAWEHVRHEEAAAFAAGAEAALTGELAVCAGSCGPGNLHLINGLFDANRSGVPVLAIAAHIPAEEIGWQLLPGNPPAAAVHECSVTSSWSVEPGQFARLVAMAMRAAMQARWCRCRRYPGEISSLTTPLRRRPCAVRGHRHSAPRPTSLAAAAELLNASDAVTILAAAAARARMTNWSGWRNAQGAGRACVAGQGVH